MRAPSLARRDENLRELMDDPDCHPARLRRTVARFGLINSLVSGWGTVYSRRIVPVLRAHAAHTGPVRILDIGCGGGDLLRRLIVRARRDGFDVRGLGIDPDERCLAVARAADAVPGVAYRATRSADLVAEGERFDIVLSNHVLHHLDAEELAALWRDTAALTGTVALHSDIVRSRVAYAGYAVAITPFAPGTFLRTDGLRSIRRSYRPDELVARLPAGWTIDRPVPFRQVAVWEAA